MRGPDHDRGRKGRTGMTGSRRSGARWCRRFVVLVAVSTATAGLLAQAAAPSKKAARSGGAPSAKPPARPAKVVTTPTLTRDGLDALVSKHLESAKVPLA